MGEENSARRSSFRPLKWAIFGTFLLGVLAHFFFGSLPPVLQQHLTFLK